MDQIATALATAFVIIGFFSFREMFQNLKRENEATKAECQAQKAENEKLKAENEKLKEANRKRMPYRSLEHLMDLLAAVDVAEREVRIEDTIIQNIRGHAERAMHEGTQQA